MIIDAHVHFFPDKIAARAVDKLVQVSGLTPCTDGTLAGAAARMEASGVSRAVLLSIATAPKQQEDINKNAVSLLKDKRFIPLGSVHCLSPSWREQLVMLKESGVKGIKLHPDYQGFMINDRAWFPVYESCQDLGLVIVFHAGWDCYSPQLIHARPKASAEVAQAFPRLKMVLAHMGGLKLEDEVLAFLAGRSNVYFDTAMGGTYMNREKVRRIIDLHPAENILFGSDCPWEDPVKTLDFVDSLGLGREARERVLAGNAIRLYGL